MSVFLETTAPQTVFEDFTNNHNKTLIQLFVVGMSAPVQVTILTRRSSVPITTILQPVQTKIFQVEDFQSLTFTKQEGSTSVVSLFVQKHFVYAVMIITIYVMNITKNVIDRLNHQKNPLYKGFFSFHSPHFPIFIKITILLCFLTYSNVLKNIHIYLSDALLNPRVSNAFKS